MTAENTVDYVYEENERPIEKKKLTLLDKLKRKFKLKSKKQKNLHNESSKSSSSTQASSLISKSNTKDTSISSSTSIENDTDSDSIHSFRNCKICLNNFGSTQSISCKLFELSSCKCKFCINCLYEYIKESIENCDVLPINCPDSSCKLKGYLNTDEVRTIICRQYDATDINNNYTCETDYDKVCFVQVEDENDFNLFNKYLKICENIQVLRDPFKTHCPKPMCQNVCSILAGNNKSSIVKVICDKCKLEFCSKCSRTWCPSEEKASFNNKFDSHSFLDMCDCNSIVSNEFSTDNFQNFENIKRCPNCSILIERADGCAQIMCKICKHTFCFYCLTSLENDYLLKHYTKKGPCQGKLGHSRISLFFHRLSVIAVFSGTIVLIIILSPFLLFALPCIILNRKIRNNCLKKISTKFG